MADNARNFDPISFKKVGDKFMVRVSKGVSANTGDTVDVAKRDGSTTSVKLGRMVEENQYGDKIFEIVGKKK